MREARRPLDRRRQGRVEEPSVGRIDSPRLKTAPQGAAVGVEGGKRVTGRPRHGFVETLGLLLAGVVTAANTDDRVGWVALLKRDRPQGVVRLRKRGVDQGYRAPWLPTWGRGLKRPRQIDLEVTVHSGQGFPVIPWRWAVERPVAWLVTPRRHRRDDDVLTVNREAMSQIRMSRLLLNRLAG